MTDGVTYIGVDLQFYGTHLDHARLEHWLSVALTAAMQAYQEENAESTIDVWEFSEFEHAGEYDQGDGGISGPWESGVGTHE